MTRLLLISAAGLDWAGFEAAAPSELAALRVRGVAGWLAGAPLSDGPAAWASLATGVQPEAHGVWRGQEEWPGGLRPTGKASWRAAPVWARLAAAGVRTGSVAWPASRPGAGWPGVHLDDRFPESTSRTPEDWALPLRCLPEALRGTLRDRRVHVSQITGDMLAPLVPGLAGIDSSRDDGLTTLALGMAQAATIQAAATWMLREGPPGEGPPDAVFIHHPWLHQIRQAFERRREAHFADVIPAAWRLLGGLVGALAALAGPEALVLVVSPGWRSGLGVFLAAGPGVTPNPETRGAGLLDIAPTVLGRFGLEDAALPGRLLAPVAAGAPLAPAPSPPMGAPPIQRDSPTLAALVRLGYQPPAPPALAWRADGLAELALMMLDRDPAGAGEVADAALRLDPGHAVALTIRARAHVALGEPDPLPALAEALTRAAPDRGWAALARGAYHVMRREKALATPWLLKAEADRDPATLLTTAAVWLAAGRPGAAMRVFAAVLAEDPLNVAAEIGLAMGEIARRDFLDAELRLRRAARLDPGRPAIWLQLAQSYARSGRKGEAAAAAATAARLGAPPALAAAARAGRLRG